MDMKAYDLIYRFVMFNKHVSNGEYPSVLIAEAEEYLRTALPTEEEYRKAEENC